MAPVKKSKSINKGFTVPYDSSCSRDEKSKPKKRKLSDMIGPQWSKAELQRFYEAYRKYGRDWKKVAVVVRSRSTEMVEALYTMNRAYLSLPEGAVSVSGLIAMMTDHYNVMDGSGSEKETEDITLMARKVQKHQKAKGRPDFKRQVSFQRQSISSSDKLIRENSSQRPSTSSSGRGISFPKMFDGIQPNFPVRKRTPRVPVSQLDSHVNKMPERSVMNGNDDDERSHRVPLLAKAKENPNLARDSETMYKRVEHFRISQASSWEKPKSDGLGADEESVDDSLGSYEDRMEKKFKNSVDSRSALNDYKRGKKEKKKELDASQAIMFNDVRDTHKFSNKGPMINEDSVNEGVQIGRSHSGHRKRNKTQIFEDERVACDALQTLAEMSLLMPYLDTEPAEDARESVAGRYSSADKDAQFDAALQEDSPVPSKKRKPRSSKVEQHLDHSEKQFEKEIFADGEVKSGDSNVDLSAVSKRRKTSVRSPDLSSSNDQHMGEAETVVSSTQVQASSHVIEPTRRKCRRKRDRTIPQKDRNHANGVFSSQCSSLFQGSVQCAKEKVLHCLSWPEVRRWCSYEWFYSAIDYPWFARREFVEYLNHVGLGHIPRLTRVEWGVIRSSLGKPRRFSERFLQEEREKLEQYRESVRSHYANVRAGLGDGLPNDLARPLSVGQQVVGIHPKTRELHNGSVLAVDHHSCLVQFDRRDLGVEFVKDIDCMPLNPVENMPESRRQHKMFCDYRHSKLPKINEAFMLASDEHMQIRDPPLRAPPFSPAIASDVKVKQVCMNSHLKVAGDGCPRTQETTQIQDLAHMQPRKADVMPSPCLTQGLATKVSGQHPLANSDCVNGTLHTSDSSIFRREEETTSNVVEIVQGSMQKAQKMVDVAVKAMSSMRKGEDAYGRIGEAFDACKAERVTDCRMSPVMISSDTAQGGLTPQNAIASSSSTAACDLQVPSELISSCVSTLLMIQTCTERQYPPSEVAQILDTAVRSLHPCSSQNLSIYREIQMCMGRIKTQILALVPS
ncbi:protein ALWAYS EARLY 3-like isoform X2 [Silene latifolia]|uniref:protein ALWAYS EARLY 3-like isoform X2 n=1 Tax=Silene latifolia TaxID=37657 RepID=UPI003D77E221